jgi:hypothetical protein
MKSFLALLLTVFLASFLSFPVNAQEEKDSDQKEEEEEEVIVNYEIVQQGTYSGKRDTIAKLIATQAEWEQLWKQHVSVLVPQPPVPQIDFETEVVVAIFAGEKKSGGYAVVIKDVSAEVNDVVVTYRFTEPQPGSFTIQVITQPYVILKMDKPKGIVRLVQG